MFQEEEDQNNVKNEPSGGGSECSKNRKSNFKMEQCGYNGTKGIGFITTIKFIEIISNWILKWSSMKPKKVLPFVFNCKN